MSEKMTLSQALRRRKKLKGELAEWTARAEEGVTWKNTEQPAFPFTSSMEKIDSFREELIALEAAIAHTNAANRVAVPDLGTITLTQVVFRLKELKGQIKWFSDLKSQVKNQKETVVTEREYDDDMKMVSAKVHYTCMLPEEKRTERVTLLRANFDALNAIIEDANHRTTLIG